MNDTDCRNMDSPVPRENSGKCFHLRGVVTLLLAQTWD